jgi:hypothetical protein
VANKSLSPEPADPPWQVTSITTFQPSSLILYPDLWIPGNESVVTITAPRGAVINTYPGATTEAIPGRDEVKLTIKLPISILDTAPLDVVIETSPEWGRDPNFAILWGLSVSNVIAAVLGVLELPRERSRLEPSQILSKADGRDLGLLSRPRRRLNAELQTFERG